jgi:hypothetical protein
MARGAVVQPPASGASILGPGQHIVGENHRLSPLEMGVAGHDGRFIGLGLG